MVILRDRYVPAWPRQEAPAYALPIAAALSRAYTTDAHFAAYAPATDPVRRLSLEGFARLGAVRMILFVVDIDPAGHGRSPEWDADVRERIERLPGEPFGYWTRGGARVVYALDREVTDPDDWTRWYLRQLVAIAHLTGIAADPACSDPTRLFRMPHATRDGELQRLGWIRGGPSAIGRWTDVELEEADLLATLGALEVSSVAWRRRAERLSPKREPAPPPPPAFGRRPDASRALRFAAEKVAGAGQGDRNAELFRRCRWLAGLVARGEVSRGEVVAEMTRAARAAGLGPAETRRTIESALGERAA
jgi:hypothetical protein